MRPTIHCLVRVALAQLLVASAPLHAAELLARLAGPDLGHVTLEWIDPANPAAPAITGFGPFEPVPTELSLTYIQDGLLTDRPRAVKLDAVYPNVILMPTADQRRVIRYARGDGAVFGFLAIDATGTTRVLIERPAASPYADPFDLWVAFSSTGKRMLVSIPSGDSQTDGEVWLIRTDGGQLGSGSPSQRLLTLPGARVDGRSLAVADGRVFAVLGNQLLSAPDDGSGPLTPLSIPLGNTGAPQYVCPLLAMSEERNRIALLAGSDPSNVDLYLVNVSSGAIALRTQAASAIHPTYSYIADPLAPHLALSRDGDQVGWKALYGTESELFIAAGMSKVTPIEHVTKAPAFEAYIDTVGGILGSGSRMMFVAASSYQGQADVYSLEVQDGGAPAQVENITATSGQNSPPFTSTHPAKMVIDRRWRIGDTMLLSDDQSGFDSGWHLWRVNELEESAHLATDLIQPARFAVANHGTDVALTELRSSGVTTYHLVAGHEEEGDDEDEHALAPAVLALPSWIDVDRMALATDADTIALSAALGPNQVFVGAIPLGSGAPVLAPGGPYASVDQLFFSGGGTLLITAQSASGARSIAFDPTGGQTWTATSPVAVWVP